MGLIEARSYVHKIRNSFKKKYAKEYLYELQWGIELDEEKYKSLSYMARQGVRMHLDRLYLWS